MTEPIPDFAARAKRMFGGHGLYLEGLMVGLISAKLFSPPGRSAVARHHAPVTADDRLRQQEGQQQQSLAAQPIANAGGDLPC